MKTPRKLKKEIKKAKIVYDIAAIPDGIDSFEKLWAIFKTTGFLFFDAEKGTKPIILPKNKRTKILKYDGRVI